MRIRIGGWLVVWILCLIAVWCSPTAAQTVLKVGTQYSTKSPAVQALQKFADYVKEKTDGKYAVGMSYRGAERAVLWDTSDPDPAGWRVVDLTEVAAANGSLDGFARLSRAYSVGMDASGALVITGAGQDTSALANTRAFVMTVSPPIAPIAFPPIITTFGLFPDGFTCSFLSLANPDILYYLEATTNLAQPSSWTPISFTPGTGGLTSLSDANRRIHPGVRFEPLDWNRINAATGWPDALVDLSEVIADV